MCLLSYLSSSGFGGGAGDLHVIRDIYRWILLGFYTHSLDFVEFSSLCPPISTGSKTLRRMTESAVIKADSQFQVLKCPYLSIPGSSAGLPLQLALSQIPSCLGRRSKT